MYVEEAMTQTSFDLVHRSSPLQESTYSLLKNLTTAFR
jgi:hypothetical protein